MGMDEVKEKNKWKLEKNAMGSPVFAQIVVKPFP
jgi:hypothetical protein